MLSPITGKEMTVRKSWRKMTYRKEEFDVYFHTWYCEDSGEEFEDEKFANINYRQVINLYRAKNAIPSPEDITAIREKYGLNKTQMASVLGFGVNTYRQYEDGEIPTEANAKFIQLAENPNEFLRLLNLPNGIEEETLEKLRKRVHKLIEKEYENREIQSIENYLFNGSRKDALTGFKKPDLQKFMQMVLFFSERIQPLKTKLNKLLCYSDMKYFQVAVQSISGAKYRAINKGFVPEKYDSIYEYMEQEGMIEIVHEFYKNGHEGEKFTALQNFDSSLFNNDELKILDEVYKKFEKTSVNDIVDLSHQEKAWDINKDTPTKEINYIYAFDLIH